MPEYIAQGYYITLTDLNTATAFHISHYMLDYCQKYATYSALERPSGITDYNGGYIKDEYASKGDTYTTSTSDEQTACEAEGGTWDSENSTCTPATSDEQKACEADGGTWDSEASSCTKKEESSDTSSSEQDCVNNGGTWDGSACTYPTNNDSTNTDQNTSTDTTTGALWWYDRRNLLNIFDKL